MAERLRVLLVGGTSGVLGGGIRAELASRHQLVSFHRHPDPGESPGIEFAPGDVTDPSTFPTALRDIDAVVNLVWYRAPGPDSLFRRTVEGLRELARQAARQGIRRWVQISLPPAPPRLERSVPYLFRRRELEAALLTEPMDVVRIQPSAVFAPRDRLVQVMLQLMERHHRFPLWGDGEYHVSPIHTRDVAWLVGEALAGRLPPLTLAGGPDRYTYRQLVEMLFAVAGLPPRWVRLSPGLARRLVQALNAVGYHALYTYELDWLMSDLLGLPEPPHPGRSFARLEDFLRSRPRAELGTPAPPSR